MSSVFSSKALHTESFPRRFSDEKVSTETTPSSIQAMPFSCKGESINSSEEAHVLCFDHSKLWISDDISKADIAFRLWSEDVSRVKLAAVGWYCWHPYKSNPKSVTLQVLWTDSETEDDLEKWHDVITFNANTPRVGVQAYALPVCMPVPRISSEDASIVFKKSQRGSDIDIPTLKLRLVFNSAFGADRVYVNQLYFFSEEEWCTFTEADMSTVAESRQTPPLMSPTRTLPKQALTSPKKTQTILASPKTSPKTTQTLSISPKTTSPKHTQTESPELGFDNVNLQTMGQALITPALTVTNQKASTLPTPNLHTISSVKQASSSNMSATTPVHRPVKTPAYTNDLQDSVH